MANFEKPGVTKVATDADHLWLQCSLRYERNASLATSSRHFFGSDGLPARGGLGVVPNLFTTFAGVTSRYPGVAGLRLLVRSWSHTDHARYWNDSNAWAAGYAEFHLPNVTAKIQNSSSIDLGLMMEGRMRELDTSEEPEALAALNGLRRIKGWPEFTLDPPSLEAQTYNLYLLEPTAIYTQGERYADGGQHVGEGHPVLDVARLVNFEDLPARDPQAAPLLNRDEAFRFLYNSGYQHSVVSDWAERNL